MIYSCPIGLFLALLSATMLQSSCQGQTDQVPAVNETEITSDSPASPERDSWASGRRLQDIHVDLFASPSAMPTDLAALHFAPAGTIYQTMGTSQPWEVISFQWHSPAFTHRPVYFQQVALERYGLSHGCLQPVLSGVRFYTSAALWPVFTVDEMRRSQASNVGFARPGSVLCR